MARVACSPDLKGIGSMLAIAVSLLFGLAACAALAVIRVSLLTGWARARLILAELAEFDRQPLVTRLPSARSHWAPQPGLAAA
jgi:L-arabinose isomerase